MIPATYWTPKSILEALVAAIEARCTQGRYDGESGGGTGFETVVLTGDENLNKWQDQARGRVVVVAGDGGPVVPPGEAAVEEMLGCWRAVGEAHIWAPSARVAGLDRIDAAWRIAHCVSAALHDRHHGWPSAPDMPIAEIMLVREPKLLLHGQAALVTFPYRVPIFFGRPVAAFGAGSSIGTAAPGGGGGLVINPE